MSDNINPYTASFALEETHSDTRAPAAANGAAKVEDTPNFDETPMTAEEMAISLVGYAPRSPSSSAPPVVTRPVFTPHCSLFRPYGNEQIPAAKHAPSRLSSFEDMTPPSSGVSVGPTVPESFDADTGNNHADGLGRDINHSGNLTTTSPTSAFGSSVRYAAAPSYFPEDEQDIHSALRSGVATPNYAGPPGYFPDDEENIHPALRSGVVTPNYAAPPGGFLDDEQNTYPALRTPKRRQAVGYPVGNNNVGGYFDSNGVHVASVIPACFSTDYVSPYIRGSVHYFGATGYPHGRGSNVGDLVPGRIRLTSASSSYAEHASENSSSGLLGNIDVNGVYENPVNSVYPETYQEGQSYGGHSFTTQGPHTDTAPSSVGDYNGYQRMAPTQQQMASKQCMDPKQYLALLQQMTPNQYVCHDSIWPHQGIDSYQNVAPHPPGTKPNSVNSKPKPKKYVKRVDNRVYKRGQKKTYGSLYNEDGKLPFPISHYREYMNGSREMNGKLAESQLAPIPCSACAVRGLTCSVLSREGDHGKVFTRMRRPWHNQEVSNYIVCGNCWNQMGSPQTCSFWRRPEGKEIPPTRHW